MRSMSWWQREGGRLACVWFGLAAFLCPPVLAQPWPILVDIGSDRARFVVEQVDAKRSLATRINDDLVSKAGQVPGPTPGYELRSTLIVISDDPELFNDSGLRATRLEPFADIWLVEAGSVNEAIFLTQIWAPQPSVSAVYLDAVQPFGRRSLQLDGDLVSDPMFDRQWTLRNTTMPGADARVVDAWELGVSGNGITIGLIEHEIDHAHPDLVDRFDAQLSIMGDASPDAHSTAVASIAVASRNGIGLVGAAPEARIATMPRGSTVDTIRALLHEPEAIRIKMATWGREDRRRLSRMDPATREALQWLTRPTDGSPGTPIVWAAGNGGLTDRLDYDAITSSRFVFPVASVGDLDLRASYTRPGSAQFISAHSSGNARSVIAAQPGREWTTRFSGTSAAAPLAAGAIALAIELNPDLSVRDLEHLLAKSARKLDERSGVWITNSAGVSVSELHGFGAINAAAMVEAAQGWAPVAPEIQWSSGKQPVGVDLVDPDHHHNHAPDEPCAHEGHSFEIEVETDLRIEHVELIPVVRTTFVGDLSVVLTSPGGMVSVLALPRDDAQNDLRGHIFTSRRHWGESARGTWTVTITDEQPGDQAHWESIELRFFGTAAVLPATPKSNPSVEASP